jgi:hypothetical protein
VTRDKKFQLRGAPALICVSNSTSVITADPEGAVNNEDDSERRATSPIQEPSATRREAPVGLAYGQMWVSTTSKSSTQSSRKFQSVPRSTSA